MKARLDRDKKSKIVGVRCACGSFKSVGVYGVGQMAMWHELSRTCDCGAEITISSPNPNRYAFTIEIPPKKKSRTSR